jgi:hypothetical protein
MRDAADGYMYRSIRTGAPYACAQTRASRANNLHVPPPRADQTDGCTMEPYRHHVAGFFARPAEAENALSGLIARGLRHDRLLLLKAGTPPADAAPLTDSQRVRDDMLSDGAIGAAVGTGIGALAELALVAANVSLFIASPLVAPLVMLGWGASLGGFIGATAGAGSDAGTKDGKFAALIHDGVASGQTILVAETHSAEETAFTEQVMQAAAGDTEDLART